MDEFSTNWPMAHAAVEVGQGMTAFGDNSKDLQIMGTFTTSSIHSVDNLQNLQNSETISSNFPLRSWNWDPPIPTDFMMTREKPGHHPALESSVAQFPFCWDNLFGSQIYEPAGYQSVNTGAQSTGSTETYNIPSSQLDSMASSSTTYSDFSKLASIPFTFGDFSSEHTAPNASLPAVIPGKTNRGKRRHRSSISAAFSDNPLPRKKAKIQRKKAVVQFESGLQSDPKCTVYQEAATLLSQIKQLLDKETSLNRVTVTADLDDNTRSDVPSQASLSSLNAAVSGSRVMTRSESPSTPCQPAYSSQNANAMEVDTLHPPSPVKMYQCTFIDCYYSVDSPVDWKRHEEKEGHWPQERFMCLQCNLPKIDLEGNLTCSFCFIPFSVLGDAKRHYLQCVSARERGKTFGRKDHLCKHLEVKHPEVEHTLRDMADLTKSWSYPLQSDWPRECGFCGQLFETWDERIRHVRIHYQDGFKKSSWKLPFPLPKDHGSHEIESSPSNEDDDDDDDNDSSELYGNVLGYKIASSQILSENRSLNNDRQHESESQQTYRERAPHSAFVDLNHSADCDRKPEIYMTRRGLTAFPLGHMFGHAKIEGVREYLDKCNHILSGGVFWLDLKLAPSVESSLWNIAFQVALHHQKQDCLGFQILLNMWAKVRQVPRGLQFSRRQLDFRQQFSNSTVQALAGAASPDCIVLSQQQHSGRPYHQSVDNTAELSPSKFPISNTNSNYEAQSENQTDLVSKWISTGYMGDKFSNSCHCQSIPQASLPSQPISGASHRRGPWSQGEDAYLVQLVHTEGALNWVRIAQLIGSRSPKQCRERYHQNLSPTLNHEPISPEEGLQIERMVGEMGKRWSEIARRLHGRSDNAVKNWWNGGMNRRRRLDLRRRPSNQCPSSFDEQPQSLSFARPAAKRALTITSSNSSIRRIDSSIPSRTVSQPSSAEMTGSTPSLISDNSSHFSISPRLAHSPSIELPPLNSFSRDFRRPKLPILEFRPNAFLSEADNQTYPFSSRFHDSRAHCLCALSPPVQLPPLDMTRSNQPKLSREADTRMTLSSLLG
jgi:Myb-like DNA-binding protein FlbD